MPCLSGRFDVGIGALTSVAVLPIGAFLPTAIPPVEITTFAALIDTGATTTCITPDVAQTVGLEPIGKRPMVSATHSVDVDVYLGDLFLPFGKSGLLLSGIQLMSFATPAGSPFKILLGRDIICRGTFTMSFDGHFTLSL